MTETREYLPEVVDAGAGVRHHIVAALLASLKRVSALEALILDADPLLLSAERAAIRELQHGPREAA